jgi:Mrp family chromosome partitioning ATPase
MRTLLMDADLRSPDSRRIFHAGAEGGLGPWLATGDTGEEPPMLTLETGLWWMPPGGVADNAGELLSSSRFSALADRTLRDFDIVVADTAPANYWADARIVAAALGGAVVVARRGVSYVDDVATLDRELADDRVKLFGAVLNNG